MLLTVKLASGEISISLEASHILKYLLVNKSGRVGLPAIEEQAQILDQENGRGQDIERLVLPKVGSKIRAYFKSLKRGQIIQQLIHDVRHILGQCKWAQKPKQTEHNFQSFQEFWRRYFLPTNLRADSKSKLDKWLQKWDGPSYAAGKDKSSSIAILFMKNTQFEVNKISEDENGRFLLVNGTKNDKNVTLCNIYAPSGPQNLKERKLFFENLKDSISDFQPDNSKLILGGDFNCVTDVDLDRSRTVSKTDSSVNKLKNILNNFQLKDIWRHHNPDKKEFTFYSNVGTGSRLDKFYLTKDLTPNVIESNIQNFAHTVIMTKLT